MCAPSPFSAIAYIKIKDTTKAIFYALAYLLTSILNRNVGVQPDLGHVMSVAPQPRSGVCVHA